MFRWVALAFCLPLVCMTSCATSSKMAKMKVESGIDIEQEYVAEVEGSSFREGDFPACDWWTMFQDPELDKFIMIALADNPSLQSVQAKITQAEQEAYVSRAGLFPQLGALMNVIWTNFCKNGLGTFFPGVKSMHLYDAGFNFNYEFDFWKKNMNSYEAYLGEAEAQKALYAEARLILSTAVAKQYFYLQSTMMKSALTRQLVESRTKQLGLTDLRKVNRIDNLMNINQMKQELLIFQEALVALDNEIRIGEQLLKILMGKNPTESLTMPSVWKSYREPIDLPQDLGINLLARRPDLMASVWRAEKAARFVGVATAGFYPNINLMALGAFQSLNFQTLFQGVNSLTGLLLPSLAVPIFTGGQLNANLKAKLAAYESAVYQYNDLLLHAAQEVVEQISRINAIDQTLSLQKEEIALIKDNYDLVYSRYSHGIDSLITVISSDEQYLVSKMKQIDLEEHRYTEIIKFIKALGGGYEGSAPRCSPKGVVSIQ